MRSPLVCERECIHRSLISRKYLFVCRYGWSEALALRECGVPNYYGPQRMGKGGKTARQGACVSAVVRNEITGYNMHSCTCTRTYTAHPNSLTHPLTHSLTQSLTHSHSVTHSLTHSLALSLTHSQGRDEVARAVWVTHQNGQIKLRKNGPGSTEDTQPTIRSTDMDIGMGIGMDTGMDTGTGIGKKLRNVKARGRNSRWLRELRVQVGTRRWLQLFVRCQMC
jgi:hypothetical protein